jgi:Cu/Ag efflux protein CusF
MLKRIKKMKVAIIASALAALMLCGWTAYATTSSSASTSTTLTGELTTLTANTITLHTETGDQTVPLAASVWVYLNDEKAQVSDLKTGDKVELILNNKKQAAYVKGISATDAGATAVAEPSPSAVPIESPTKEEPSPSASPTPSPTTLKDSESAAQPAPTLTPSSRSDLKDVDVSVDGQQFNLHIRQSMGAHGFEFELTCQSPGTGKIHLTGDQARTWISQILGNVDLTVSGAQQALGQRLAKQYDLDANKINVHFKADPVKDVPKKDDDNDSKNEKEKENAKDKERVKEIEKPEKQEQNKQQHGNSQKRD